MPLYQFRAQSASGQEQVGTLNAENSMMAAAILRNQGQRVLQIGLAQQAKRKSGSGLLKSLNYSSGPSQKDVLDFTIQLAVMIRAGISIRNALEGIGEQVKNPKWRAILHEIRVNVESGQQFSEAISKYPKLFGPLYINMVRASEMSGSFAKMLDRIAAYMQQQQETRKMVIGAMIYPGIIGTMAVGVTIFLLTFVLPRFAVVFEGKEDRLPKPTTFLLATSDFIISFWYVLVGIGFAIGIAIWLALKTRPGRVAFDRLKLTIPVMKNMFRALYINRSLHTMGELLAAGVPMLDALQITGDVSGNILYRRMWRSVHRSVQEGKKIITSLQKSTLLPTSVVQMIAAGEESGKLAETLEEIAAYYSRLLRDAIKAVTSMIEPIMIVAMGSVVGFIAMAIVLPIFKMSSLVS